MSNLSVDYQLADDLQPPQFLPTGSLPSKSDVTKWLETAFSHLALKNEIALCVRIVSHHESQNLNNTYRGKDYATNVLSFESDIPDFVESPFIGDLVICASIVEKEALAQNKEALSHWAHMCIHGFLHLLGYDHIQETDAQEMETLEIAILEDLEIDNPYVIK